MFTGGALNIALVCLAFIAVILCAYLLGSINFAIIISGKKYKDDIRSHGSKNAGMTNMMRTYGKSAAVFTLVGDALKAVVSCVIGYLVMGQLGAYAAGLFCMVGHVFPLYYGFKGGKGVVTAAATVLMTDPLVFLILIVLFIIMVAIWRYISLASITCIGLYPLVLSFTTKNFAGKISPFILFTVLMAFLIIGKHWPNIQRLREGTESKFSFKKSVKTPSQKESQTENKNTDEEK
ncbi:MAG: glycerol-3-phosphate 1-O-acyltransferase PlsY [Ruminococcaceae bacterium]|nr:glycerol-3-phosphate 1-O-acyltransferase PlsY [Oscillospiraceae bacterium]